METIQEQNCLIAEFMGVKDGKFGRKEIPHRRYSILRYPQSLRYHTSWDWLMPVVEKITNVDTRKFEGNLMAIARYESVVKRTISEPIDVIYRATIEFIKWYNTQLHLKSNTI